MTALDQEDVRLAALAWLDTKDPTYAWRAASRLAWVILGILDADRHMGIESDAYAFSVGNTIVIDPVTGDSAYDDRGPVLRTAREARCLAASILRAAGQAETEERERT